MATVTWPEDDRPPGRPDVTGCSCLHAGWREHDRAVRAGAQVVRAQALVELLERADTLALGLDADLGSEDAAQELRMHLPALRRAAERFLRVAREETGE